MSPANPKIQQAFTEAQTALEVLSATAQEQAREHCFAVDAMREQLQQANEHIASLSPGLAAERARTTESMFLAPQLDAQLAWDITPLKYKMSGRLDVAISQMKRDLAKADERNAALSGSLGLCRHTMTVVAEDMEYAINPNMKGFFGIEGARHDACLLRDALAGSADSSPAASSTFVGITSPFILDVASTIPAGNPTQSHATFTDEQARGLERHDVPTSAPVAHLDVLMDGGQS